MSLLCQYISILGIMNSKISERSKKIGLKIRLERTKKGLTQEKLAELAGRNTNSISAIERGESSATIETLERIASALGLKFEDLINISKVDL